MGTELWYSALLLVTCLATVEGFDGYAYYNARYGAHGIAYTTVDNDNGLWSSYYHYQYSPSGWQCSGCICTHGIVTSCTGTSVVLTNMVFPSNTAGTFSNATTSITIMRCPSLVFFEEGTFKHLTNLTQMLVQGTSLNHVPDLSNTKITRLNLVNNKIRMNTGNYQSSFSMPHLQYLALMDNKIDWIPKKMVSGANLRIASFSNNQLTQLQHNIFGDDLSSLVYLGVDGNQIKKISRSSIEPLASAHNFVHFNASNNQLDYLQTGTFRQIPQIKIIELHRNMLSKIQYDSLSNLHNLLHLDLHSNNIAALTSKSFENLPSLMELRLHSQKTPMTSIAHDAWLNIGDELLYLFISSNDLSTFPHPLMEKGSYPKLKMIFADNNRITNVTAYGSESFTIVQRVKHQTEEAAFHFSFTTYPAVTHLYLHNNQITYITRTAFCNITSLGNLYLQYNLIKESTMDVDAFKWRTQLTHLDISYNLIQYVPEAVKTSDVLPAITTLYMTSNKLTFLESGTFSNLSTVLQLDLTSNGILAIEDGAFPDQLQRLHLNSNDFRFLHQQPFSNLASLYTLDLTGNEIDYLPEEAFHNMTSLRSLNLSHNRIPQLLKTHFRDCPLTDTASFASNDIGWIEDGTFAKFTSMRNLYLNNNKLTRLPLGGDFTNLVISSILSLSSNRIMSLHSHTFVNLTVGWRLDLRDNKITTIETEAFNGLNAYYLTVWGNPIRSLKEKSFTRISLSTDLDLSGQSFTDIPTHAFYSVSARNISLQGGIITNIYPEAFYDVVVSYSLNIANNHLHTIQWQLFGGRSSIGEYLFLSGNQLTGMSYNAFDSVDISYIYLNGNNITVFPQALLLQNPQRLYLANNELSQIPEDSFNGMPNLKELYLGYNKLETLEEADMFANLASLQIL